MKNEFLKQLEKELHLLSEKEIKDVLNFYTERIDRHVFEEKSEEDIINELEYPKMIARNIYNEMGINHVLTEEDEEVEYFISKFLKITSTLFLDIFLAIPIIVSTWAVAISALVASLAIGVVVPLFAIVSDVSLIEKVVHSGIGICASVFAFYMAVLFLEIVLIITKKILILHFKAFGGNKMKIEKLSNFSVIKKGRKTAVSFKITSFFVVIFTLVGLLLIGASLVYEGQLKRMVFDEDYLNESIEYSSVLSSHTVGENATVSLESSAKVNIITSNANEIKVVIKYDYEKKISAEVTKEGDNFIIKIEDDRRWFNYIKIDRIDIEIQIPKKVGTVKELSETLDINTKNQIEKSSLYDVERYSYNII